VSVQAAREILDAVLTPVGRAPAARQPAPHAAPPVQAYPPQPPASLPPQAGFTPQAGLPPRGAFPAPPQSAPQPGVVQCRVCGQRQEVGAMFCGNCGSRFA
jgi:hypothetical protein